MTVKKTLLMGTPVLLETTRLIIRNFVPKDAADLHEILGDARTMQYCEPPYDFAKTEQFLQNFCVERGGGLAAAEKSSGKVIGYILFKEISPGEYELGWFFNRKIWGRGYAYEACCAVIDYAFRVRKADKIIAETIDTVKSLGLMKRLGMRLEATQEIQTEMTASGRAVLHTCVLYKPQAL